MGGPRYPDVPDTDGVPPVYRNDSNPITPPGGTPAVQPTDSAQVQQSARPDWAIVKPGGASAIDVDSIVGLAPSRDFRNSDYPVENGGFQSYNKVATPAETRVIVTKEGGDSDRQGFFDQLDALIETTDLVNIVTPDSAFLDRNLTHYDYDRRADKGRALITVELIFEEIRQTAKSAFTDSKQPSGNDPVNDGPVQPQSPTGPQTPPGPPA